MILRLAFCAYRMVPALQKQTNEEGRLRIVTLAYTQRMHVLMLLQTKGARTSWSSNEAQRIDRSLIRSRASLTDAFTFIGSIPL